MRGNMFIPQELQGYLILAAGVSAFIFGLWSIGSLIYAVRQTNTSLEAEEATGLKKIETWARTYVVNALMNIFTLPVGIVLFLWEGVKEFRNWLRGERSHDHIA